MPEGKEEMSKCQSNPSAEFRFFLYEPEGDEFTYFSSPEDRDEYAKGAIAGYLDDGWIEDVEQVIAGEITHTTQQTQRVERPAEIDEDGHDQDGNYWDSDWDYKCHYELLPIDKKSGEKK